MKTNWTPGSLEYLAEREQHEHAVLVRVNDRSQRVVTKIRAKLSKEQAATISNELNSTFASQGLNWFADIRPLED